MRKLKTGQLIVLLSVLLVMVLAAGGVCIYLLMTDVEEPPAVDAYRLLDKVDGAL